MSDLTPKVFFISPPTEMRLAHPVYVEGDRMRRAREMAGLTIAQASHKLLLSCSLLEQCEAASRFVTQPDFVDAVSRFYCVSVAWLCGLRPLELQASGPIATRLIVKVQSLSSESDRRKLLIALAASGVGE